MKTKHSHLTQARRATNTLLLLALIGLAGVAQAAPPGTSPAELLEQGVYAEETKGDIEAAIKLYQQVAAETKTGQAVGAQAQYRLGVCYNKKKEYTAATAAFEKLIREYPDQKELVTRANEYLANSMTLLPAPWGRGDKLELDIKFATGVKGGSVTYSVAAGEMDGRKIWRLSSQLSVATVEQSSQVEVEADSFKPIHCLWKHSVLGEADMSYGSGRVDLTVKGKDSKRIEQEGVCYDNEEVIQLIRRLPLAANYSTTLRVFSGLGGGVTIPIKLEVVALEKVEVPAGTFECFKINLSMVNQTFWYSNDSHRYLVKFEAGGIEATLAKIEPQ